MILVDTSVWIDHLRDGDPALTALLERGEILAHPFVTGELALGSLRGRDAILAMLRDMPQAIVADDDEVVGFITGRRLHGRGIGYVDAHLVAAALLTPAAVLWTRDKRLRAIAREFAISADPDLSG